MGVTDFIYYLFLEFDKVFWAEMEYDDDESFHE